MNAPVQVITPDQWQKITDDPNTVLIDLRSPEEYRQSHIPNAINIPYEQLRKIVSYRRKKLVLYCEQGIRSTAAAMFLADHGYRVATLQGGIEAWNRYRRIPDRR